MRKYIAYDCETGGRDSDLTSLLTVTFRVLDAQLQDLETLELKTKPEDGIFRVHPKALSINKINLIEHSKDAITYKEARSKLLNFLNRHSDGGTTKLTPVGHRVGFDTDFVQDQLVTKDEWQAHVSYDYLDTATIAEFLKSCLMIPNSVQGLGNLAKFFGVHEEGAHDATVDVNMTVNVLKAMKRRVLSK